MQHILKMLSCRHSATADSLPPRDTSSHTGQTALTAHGTVYAESEELYVEGDITLYAQYGALNYTVRYSCYLNTYEGSCCVRRAAPVNG